KHIIIEDLLASSFLALCNLQGLQKRRKLVNPISTAAQRHFSKWAEKPEFVFALAYKIIRDFPLVDKANLIGYSCREEWISGMIFPKQIEKNWSTGIRGTMLEYSDDYKAPLDISNPPRDKPSERVQSGMD
ncbi:hypothetical protein ACJX0J_026547, partial [Zea mays]